MREIHVSEITKVVKELCIESNYYLSKDVKEALQKAKENETWELAENILDKIIQNVVKKRRLNELKYEGLISGLTDNELVNKWLNGYSVEWKGSNKRENSITIPN